MIRSAVLTRLAAAGLLLSASAAQAQGVLTVAMTAGAIPVTGGNPDQGFEGFRFVALNLYDALINWDLSSADKPSVIKPGLATEWKVDPNDKTRWLFTLREGVKFHDGCPFTADDVVWNFGRYDEKAPQWNPQQFALSRAYLPNFVKAEKVDDKTVALTTKIPSSLFPYEMSYIVMTSRCQAEKFKYDWAALANAPSGTGPYRFDRMVPNERLELVPNKDYWDKTRIPKQDRLVLLPMPEATLRVMDWNALLALTRAGVTTAMDVDGINVSRALQDPINGMTRFMQKAQWAPLGGNWGHYGSDGAEAMIASAFNTFDNAQRDAILVKLSEKMVDEAVLLWAVHDINPRALSPKVQGFVQAQSWFQDLTPITVAK